MLHLPLQHKAEPPKSFNKQSNLGFRPHAVPWPWRQEAADGTGMTCWKVNSSKWGGSLCSEKPQKPYLLREHWVRGSTSCRMVPVSTPRFAVFQDNVINCKHACLRSTFKDKPKDGIFIVMHCWMDLSDYSERTSPAPSGLAMISFFSLMAWVQP